MLDMNTHFDVTILGSGLVGPTLACALKKQDLTVALIDKSALNLAVPENLDVRALALSLTSVTCLKVLEVWSKISDSASVIKTVHVSKKDHFGISKIHASDYDLPALGYVVNADSLNIALNQVVETLPHVTLFRPGEIVQLERETQGWAIQLNNQKKIHTKLLVAADGAASMLRKHQGIAVNTQDYQQTAIVVNIGLSQSPQAVAYERFLSEGSIAMLPFGADKVKCVWIVSNNQIEVLKSEPDTLFLENIQCEFGYRLGILKQLGKRVFYPLKKVCSETLYDDHLVLIGNAANTLSPIAAQGFNLGLRDAATLAEILIEARNANCDIGSVEVLQSYANRRMDDHNSIRYFTDSLAKTHVFQWLGILASEWITPFKRVITARGLGQHHNLPKLCRGVQL